MGRAREVEGETRFVAVSGAPCAVGGAPTMARRVEKRGREDDDGSMPPPRARVDPGYAGGVRGAASDVPYGHAAAVTGGAGSGWAGGMPGEASRWTRPVGSMSSPTLDDKEMGILRTLGYEKGVDGGGHVSDALEVLDVYRVAEEEEKAKAYERAAEGIGECAARCGAYSCGDCILTTGEPPAGARSGQMLVYKCPDCKNKDQREFFVDTHSGSVVCKKCGVEVMSRRVDDTNQYRKFEEQEDRSHHDTKPDARFSSTFNARTRIAEDGSGVAKRLAETMQYIDTNLSNMVENYGKTRAGYKDTRKIKAFQRIDSVGRAHDLSEHVIERAKTLFGVYRDVKEVERGERGGAGGSEKSRWVAAAIIAAYRESIAEAAAAAAAAKREEEAAAAGVGGGGAGGAVGDSAEPKGRFGCAHCGVSFLTLGEREEHQKGLSEAERFAIAADAARKQAEADRRWALMNASGETAPLPGAGKRKKKRKKPPGCL